MSLNLHQRRAIIALALTALPLTFSLAACGSAPSDASPGTSSTPAPNTAGTTRAPQSTTPAPSAQATVQPAPVGGAANASIPAATITFRVLPDQSKATFRVREQLARLLAPSDAVGSTGAVAGQLVLRPDSSIVAESSKITVDLSSLKTDEPQRDNFIKRNTLQTAQYPTAEFVPVQATGLPSPLPESGTAAFKLTGKMTIHGVTKDLTWDVNARRAGPSLTGTATTSFRFEDFGMRPPQVAVVLSVVDEIRLEVSLVTQQVA
jgi:polyisoprenoid-binding protein YceI